MENVLHEDKENNNDPTGVEIQSYNIKKQELTIKVFNLDENDDEKLRSIKKIKKPLPKDIIPDLAHFIDPFDYVYDKIWK